MITYQELIDAHNYFVTEYEKLPRYRIVLRFKLECYMVCLRGLIQFIEKREEGSCGCAQHTDPSNN